MSVPPPDPDTIYDSDKKPLIEVTFTYIKDQIIKMTVKKLLSGKEVKINDSKPEQARKRIERYYTKLRTVSFPRENSRVHCTFFLKTVDQDPSSVKIIYSAKLSPNSSIRFDVGWENQAVGDCAMTTGPEMPPGCLQTNIYLWKANNYRCYKGREKEHDKRTRLCVYCATPKGVGEKLLYCPQDDKIAGLEYPAGDIMKSRDPEPVIDTQ